ncbi:DAK2 domain-containing protein [Jeotgalibaca caeni]|uniref:DAK2 domain-containing protein n=1 Tax=Jeotgalibaca caeni TaxID=3028623 RepID=UPI00237EB821|nr:DAK2 domain-containing protein [Jeotgalibaca caeni]MDE1548024.1 DAK2 domain-containing protein [Jeotgalibaca caeni]
MNKTELTASDLKAMVEVAQERLSENAEYVNSLNVFPVPDGDTGTNMNLSFTSGADRVALAEVDRIDQLGKDLAKGLLMGARGNSGVILSQLFRGFSKAMEGKASLNANDFAAAFSQGVETAYKAVMKPVEGTILTVARESAKEGAEKAKHTDNIIEVMETVVQSAKVSLENTPNLLAVLKEVGVVDSGGQGLLFIYQGFLESLTGEKVSVKTKTIEKADVTEIAHHENFGNIGHAVTSENIEFGYCTEIMVRLGEGKTVSEEFDYDVFRNHLNEVGDSLLVVADDEIVKVHVHTEYPGEVMNYGQKFGSLVKIKVDNMRLQHDEVMEKGSASTATEKEMPKKPYGVIAVAAGEGVQNLFKSLGVATIIPGGQTMNPSTEDILKAIDSCNAEKTIILPNNKNIFMAAEQAAQVSDREVVVIPSKTISQGLTAMLAFDDQANLDTNKENMTLELDNVKSGQITNAVRDTEIDGLAITKDDYMGIVDGKIVTSHADRFSAVLETLRQMIDEDSEIVTLIYGEEATEEETQNIADNIAEEFEDVEVEVQAGNQPVYTYLISVE